MTGAAKPKQPFQWWCWDDYENDPALKLCSFAAQGVWMRMLRICWHSPRRGYFLLDNGTSPSMADLASLWGKPVETLPPMLAELEARGVLSRDGELIYCRRMVREQAKKAKEKAEGEATPTERELVDYAVKQSLEIAHKEEDRKAKQRARTNRSRAKKRAERTLDQMRAFEHMAAANARNEGRGVTPESVTGNVTPPVTVTLQGADVTLHNASDNNGVTPVSPYLSSIFHLPEKNPINQQRPAHSPATLSGGERAEREEEPVGPLAMQARIASRLTRPPVLIQSPSESDEAFAARCAAAAKAVAA